MYVRFFGVDDVSVPATTADAIWLARDLAALMDQVETDGAKWSKLTSIAPDDLADWWRVTLGFLDIVTRLWPDILAERRLSNPAAHRNDLIRSEVKRLRNHPPAGPVIAAGSTGSIPATAELISTIASLPQGAVVLPGLDRDLDEAAWKLLGEAGDNPSIFGHPQYGLHKLLQAIGALRQDVDVLEDMPRAKRLREAHRKRGAAPGRNHGCMGLLNRDPDMQPSALREAAARIDLVEASNEREEALAVALALCVMRWPMSERRRRWLRQTAIWRAVSWRARRVSASMRMIPAGGICAMWKRPRFCGFWSKPCSIPAIRWLCWRLSNIRCCGWEARASTGGLRAKRWNSWLSGAVRAGLAFSTCLPSSSGG